MKPLEKNGSPSLLPSPPPLIWFMWGCQVCVPSSLVFYNVNIFTWEPYLMSLERCLLCYPVSVKWVWMAVVELLSLLIDFVISFYLNVFTHMACFNCFSSGGTKSPSGKICSFEKPGRAVWDVIKTPLWFHSVFSECSGKLVLEVRCVFFFSRHHPNSICEKSSLPSHNSLHRLCCLPCLYSCTGVTKWRLFFSFIQGISCFSAGAN